MNDRTGRIQSGTTPGDVAAQAMGGMPYGQYAIAWWVKGVPSDRIGGPWWARAFRHHQDALNFLDTIRPTLHAYRVYEWSGTGCTALEIYGPER